MSYILDALRRADAERERDPARGIHAQPAAGLPARAARAAPRWIWSVTGPVLVVAAAAAWWMAQRQAPAVPLVIAASQPTAPVSPAPVVPVAAAVLPPAPPPLPTPAVEKAPAKPLLVTAALPAKAPAAEAAAVPALAASAAAPAPTAAERIHAIGDLPADVQRELPKLAISGGVHSENAAQRLLIVGGQVLNEGAEVAPGVTLERVRARSAVLKFRGYRYSVPF